MIRPSVHFLNLFLAVAVSACTRPSISGFRRGKTEPITRCVVGNSVALTFDDGPYIYLKEIVDMISAAGGKATFFFNGNNYGCIYDTDSAERVKYAYDHGFQVASHTWAHKDLTTLSDAEVINEMRRTSEAIQRITGAHPAYVRPPYGSYNDVVLKSAGSLGQTVVLWDHDSGDSNGASVDKQTEGYDKALSNHPDSLLSLAHEVYETTVKNTLPYTIKKLQSAGYNLVTVAECLGAEPYLSVGEPAEVDASWTC